MRPKFHARRLRPAGIALLLLPLSGCMPNEALVMRADNIIGLCASTYARKHPESGFPPNMEAISSGENPCVERRWVDGTEHGYLFTYRAGPPDEDGKIMTYSITARPRRYGHPWKRSYYDDQTWTLHVTEEDREATPNDPFRFYSDSLPNHGLPRREGSGSPAPGDHR